MCFQNLLLRVFPCFVVLAKKKKHKHSPRKCRLFTSRGCVLGGRCTYTKEKKKKKKKPDVASNSPVLALEHAKLNDNASVQVK